MANSEYADSCPKCRSKDLVQFDEHCSVVGMYCKDCDVLVDEHGVEIPQKEGGDASNRSKIS